MGEGVFGVDLSPRRIPIGGDQTVKSCQDAPLANGQRIVDFDGNIDFAAAPDGLQRQIVAKPLHNDLD